MKQLLLSLALAAACAANAAYLPKAIYVKQGNDYTKFNLGVAGNLTFSDNGKKLTVTGYGEVVNLDKIEYIKFSAPINETALTPSAQKEKLLQIGQEVMDNVDLNKNLELLLMVDQFVYDDYDDDRRAFSEYEWPHEFWDVHNEFRSAMKAVTELAKGNPSAVRKLRGAAVNLYRLADYCGIYTANTRNETWEKTTDADYFEMRYPAADSDFYKVRVEPSKETSRWDSPDANIELAKEINITLLKGNSVLGSAKVTTDLVQEQSIKIGITANLGSYDVTSDMTVLNTGMTDKLNVTNDGKYLMSAETNVDGKNLLIYDEMYDAIKESTHYHDEDDNCCGEDPTELISHVIRGSASADILGKLQIKAKAFGFDKLYDALSEENYQEYYYPEPNLEVYASKKVIDWNPKTGELRYTYDKPDVMDNQVKYLSNYTDASFYYDNDNKLQGYLSFENFTEEYEGYLWIDETHAYAIIDGLLIDVWKGYDEQGEHSDWYYDAYDTDTWERIEITVPDSDIIRPKASTEVDSQLSVKLMFPDLTSFVFDNYFTESAFKPLIDDYDDIIDTYYSITGHDRDDDEYWD